LIAIVTGISGQDGFFAAGQLIDIGVSVVGLTSNLERAKRACIELEHPNFRLLQFDYETPNQIFRILSEYQPRYILNFAAKSSGLGMFDAPMEIYRLNAIFPAEILEGIRQANLKDRTSFVQASSSEMYGLTDIFPQCERTPFRPQSPYGAAKLFAHNLVGVYREHFGLHASSAILFNHESVRRSEQFVTMKIAKAAARIKCGLQDTVELGDLSINRDWGSAEEYVAAVIRMASASKGDDYVIATGRMSSLRTVVEIAFGHVGLDADAHVKINPKWIRKTETRGHCGNAGKIKSELGWQPRKPLNEIIVEMVDHALQQF
jgi:GDPmannose 4,6-dehydratase